VAAGIVLFALAVALGLTLWSAKDRSNRLPLLLGWGWWILAALVITLPLDTSYLLHGPRLLYLSGAGLALLWPVLLQPIYQLPRFGRFLWVVILAIILLTSALFIRGRLAAYEQLTEPVAEVQEVMAEVSAEEGILLINLPSWLAPERNQYPIGVELVSMLGSYLFAGELMAQNLPADHPVQAVRVPDLLGEAPYNYGIHEQPQGELIAADWAPAGSYVFVVTFQDNGPRTSYRGRLLPESGNSQPLATFGPYELLAAEAQLCGSEVELTGTWRAHSDGGETAGEIPPTASLFVQLLAQDGQLISQADGPPLGLRTDLLQLVSGWQIEDLRHLQTEELGADRILLGVYDFTSGDRFPGLDANGQALPDNALTISLSDCPS
jgi:hypothetical protein